MERRQAAIVSAIAAEAAARRRWPTSCSSRARRPALPPQLQSASRPGRSGGAADAAGEVLAEALRGVAARLGLGVEDVGLDREPGEDRRRAAASAAQTSIADVEAVGHLRRVVEAVAGEAGDQRQDGDGEQAGDPGDGVVDAGGDPRVAACRRRRGRSR